MAMHRLGAFLGDRNFVEAFDELVRLRRDVRRFKTAAVGEELVEEIVGALRYAPSVGLSEPTRLVRLQSTFVRQAMLANFEIANGEALAGYRGEAARAYARLKLAGLRQAPVQFAVFCDPDTGKGRGLGCRTMPEAKAYSSACAVMLIWLSAAARGLGLGWVTIFKVGDLADLLDVPRGWTFVGCLCIGWPEEQHLDPELERAGWERRRLDGPSILIR